MSLTVLQTEILRLLAARRRASGESYVAGGVALNTLLSAPRQSRDIDLFHDTETALSASWLGDRDALRAHGAQVDVLRETPTFVEAMVERGGERTIMQWVRDSAYRFFPLVEDERFGLVLHPFDLATNKVLALAGRAEVRDWVDTLACDARLQPLGYLIWSACAKDPGYSPPSLLAAVRRLHYSRVEVNTLDFGGEPPDAGALGRQWHAALAAAAAICAALPAAELGACVVMKNGELFRAAAEEIPSALALGRIAFHGGRIGGAWPEFVA